MGNLFGQVREAATLMARELGRVFLMAWPGIAKVVADWGIPALLGLLGWHFYMIDKPDAASAIWAMAVGIARVEFKLKVSALAAIAAATNTKRAIEEVGSETTERLKKIDAAVSDIRTRGRD